ncbi:hypothetical protein G5S35_08300 [Paraburkholderia tropica]|uniref:hypothetical protein n=1 Tax=Paraburkholderia tropica TaxID=92647 RepID=UPI0015FF3B76|nr:hypothetical protein [Paraburkholderia tropica]QNB11578.1 hypothetical protein G5S35_08300 [Paraburkholderia tropica]
MKPEINRGQAAQIISAICDAAASGVSGLALTRLRESLVAEVVAVNALISRDASASRDLPTIPQPQPR